MRLFHSALNLFFPPQCGICREIIGENGGLCAACWQKLHFITAPYCHSCGYPLEYQMGEGAQCAACMAQAPQYHGHRSALYFDAASKKLVHDLKYYDQPIMLNTLAQWMAQASPDWLALPNVLLVPVPIHRYRLWRRKYNQAALLAQAVARQSGENPVPVAADALLRRDYRKPQVGLPRRQRLLNVRGSIALSPQWKAAIKARPVVLVDDVMTTGATLNACAKVLKKAGSGRVYALTLARTVLEQ